MDPTLFRRLHYRHAYLLGALSLLLIVHPFLVERVLGIALVELFVLLTLIASVIICAKTRKQVGISVSLAVLMEIARWFYVPGQRIIMPVLALLFFGYVASLLLRTVFVESRRVSSDSICGAVSVYLIFGLLWTFAYSILETQLPGSFLVNGALIEGGAGFERFIGFSFVTLTTLGYGNIVPMNPRADALSNAEAIVGQVYLTVLVARLVGTYLSQSSRESDSREGEMPS